MKDDTSTPIADDSPNEFERGKAETADRSRAEAAIEGLRQKGGVFVDAVRATRMPMVLTDPTLAGNPIIFANDAFLKLSGYSMGEVLGQQPHFMNGPDTDPRDAARFREMVRADQDEVLETVQYRKNGSRFVATVLISGFKDDTGRTLQHFMSWVDVTRRVDAEEEVSELRRTQRALQTSEAKYRGLLNSIDEGFCIIEVIFDGAGRAIDYVFLETNSAFERQTGIEGAVGRRMRDIAPDHEQHWFDIYGRIALTGEPQRFEQPAESLERYYDVYAFPVGPSGKNQVGVLFNDIGERKRAERAARESHEQQAFLLKFTDALRPINNASEIQATTAKTVAEHLVADRAMYAVVEGSEGAEIGTIRGQYVRPGGGNEATVPFPEHFTYGQFGQHTMAARYRGEPLIVSDVQTDPGYSAEERAAWAQFGVRAAVVATLSKGGRLVAEFGVHSTTARGWTEAEISLIQECAERTWAAAERARAEAALRDSERHAQLLLAELQHRVRNTLAVVRSIARRTADRSETMEEMVSHFEGRLNAFSRVQSAVTRNPEAGLSLNMIVEDELISVAAREGEQFRVKGPEICLRARPAESLSLAIHELATNAVKYGALTSKTGRIKVSWNVLKGNGGGRTLRLEWLETGLNRKPEESHEGFGHEMLRRSLPYELGAETDIQFTDDGMRFTIVMPLGPDILSKARS